MKYLRHALLLCLLSLAAPVFAQETITYTYDALGRLVRSVSSGTSTADVSYTLDPSGNRTNVTVTGVVGPVLPSFSINSVSVSEGGTATLTVTKSGTASGTLSVNYASADGTALAGSDYTATSVQTLTFLASETAKTIDVATIDDAAVESTETFTVTLSGNSPGSTIGQGSGSVTITDNDVAPIFAISDAPTITEGGDLVYTVTKTGGGAANVNYASANGTATAGSDYTAASNTLVFASGNATQTITISTIDDAAVESAETVLVNLSGATGGATISDAQGSGSITDNDIPPPSFAISAAPAVTEGGTLVYTVTKTGSGAANVNYASADGTATAGSDYTSTSGTLVFASGDTTQTISVPTNDDATVESAETVLVNLSGATGGATITAVQGSGTINDNDVPPSFAISDAPTVTEGGNLVYTVTKTGSGAADVNYASANGTATSGTDFTPTSGTLSFASSDTTKTISVPTTDDALVESSETVLMNLSGATGGATISDAQGAGTIDDNEVAPTSFAISDAPTVAEGGNLVYTVTKTGSGAANVSYSSVNGTAMAASDYVQTSGTLVFASGDTTKTISVPTLDDSLVESSETVLMNLAGATGGATITTAQGSGTINDNDVAPSFAISDAPAITEGGNLVYTVTKTGGGAADVSFASANGTALAGSDYIANSGTLTFLATDTSKTITIATTDDATLESTETVLVNLSGATGGATITTAQGSGTINDNDVAPPSFAISNAAAVSEGGTLVYTVTKAGSGAANVNYASANGTATAGSDYTSTSGTLGFASGDTTKTISVPTTDDSSAESAETVLMNLSGATGGATITAAQGSGTINDNGTGVRFSISDASATEGGDLVFTITKTGSSTSKIELNYATANGTATASGDYVSESGRVIFSSSDTSQTITISSKSDTAAEGDETFFVNLSVSKGDVTIVDGQGVGTIMDPPPTFTINSVADFEGAALVFTVTKTAAASGTLTVDYATAGGTATSGADFTAQSGRLTFASTDTALTITVPTINDTAAESSETFTVTLSNPSPGSAIGTAQGVGTIADNDSTVQPSFSVANDSVSEGGSLRFDVTMTGITSTSYSINYATANGTAIAGSDYTAKSGTLTFPATPISPTTQTVIVTTIEDTAVENDETMKLNLSGATGGATISDSQAIGTINNDDTAPPPSVSFSINNVSAYEGGSLVFTVTKTGTTSSSTSVNYATANGTAVSSSDYTAKSGTLTFAATETAKTISVTTSSSSFVEDAEDMYVNLSGASTGTTISDAQGVGTIYDLSEPPPTCLGSEGPEPVPSDGGASDNPDMTLPVCP